ncbi:MAG: hypothetical protein D6714_07720, partial [Bacteroidetes bacterium]
MKNDTTPFNNYAVRISPNIVFTISGYRFLASSILFLCGLLGVMPVQAQDFRSFDGQGNNPNHPTWGRVSAPLIRAAPPAYADGVMMPGGADRPNPREVSNMLFQQDDLLDDPLGLSDFVWAFGQFIDHDITLVPDNEQEPLFIFVPPGDPWMDPYGWGNALIPMARSAFDPATGTDPDNPREHFNAITAFIDGSAVYGSDKKRADWLRTFQDGKLKMSAGNLLPFNTIDGEKDSPVDPQAPEMADPVGISDKHFVAGDVRANENVLLLTLHTLFAREHNRLCEALKSENPDWTDEKLYQEARRRVGAAIQAIVYQEWLPAMGMNLLNYQGYDPFENPGISNVFSAAAYRLGHTLINSNIGRLDESGDILPQGNLSMKDAFFNPEEIENAGGIEPYLRGMAAQPQQDCDVKVIDDLRNFLFGLPGQGGLDLAAINIMRGRERGIPDFNTVRQAFGLDPVADFYALTSNLAWADKLTLLYGDINNLDAWVGMLAEDHVPGALFGQTILTIMTRQFSALRDGDRFYYENDPAFSPNEITDLKNTTLADIIRRNTNIGAISDAVFFATPPDEWCGGTGAFADISGQLIFMDGAPVMDVTVEIMPASGGSPIHTVTGMGSYGFEQMEACSDYMIRPVKDTKWNNGVTTYDLVLIRKQVLGIKNFDSPYQYIAADLDGSQTITVSDLVLAQKIVLNVVTDFDEMDSWRFFPADFEFENAYDPWGTPMPEYVVVSNIQNTVGADFKALKMGDVNFSADPQGLTTPSDRTAGESLRLVVPDWVLPAGEIVRVPVKASSDEILEGLQLSLHY